MTSSPRPAGAPGAIGAAALPTGSARPAVIAAAALAAAVAAVALGLRFNSSGSLPRGLYRVSSATPRRFDLVAVCPPPAAAALARARGYLAAGSCPGGVRPLGKLLVAGPGDVIELSALGLRLDGRLAPASQPLAVDAAGRPLAHAALGRRRLAPGEIWLYAPHPRSFDSRYFGPAASGALRGTLRPLWVTHSRGADATLARLLARRALPP
jgi:conjugative transfer signal peptidase TraF